MKWLTKNISKFKAKAAWNNFKLENTFELEILKSRLDKVQHNIDILKQRRNDCTVRNKTEYSGMPMSKILHRIGELEDFKEECEFDIENQKLIGQSMKQKIYEIYGVSDE